MDKIKTNSNEVKSGDTFIALKGFKEDGHKYIEDAIKNGATKIICEYGDYDTDTIIVPNTKDYLNEYLDNNYSCLFNNLKIIGITGTNGKTTTAFITHNMLNKLGFKSAYIGTIGFYINGDFIKDLNNTTPDTLTLYKLIKEAYDNDCKYIVMEVSSHSLDMNRLSSIKLDIALFTNLTQDHLDYHKDMDNYLNSKLKIIDYLKDDGVLIVNNDSEYSKYFNFKNKKSIGFNTSTYQVTNYINSKDLINFKYNDNEYSVKINLKSKFNVYNYMSSLSILNSLGISNEDIISVSSLIDAPPGRMETIIYKNNYIIIDYAHTPDAVEKIISAAKETFDKKIITIVGCGGNRDKTKRPIMGRISTTLSDYVIFTSDNPRYEDPKSIIDDIVNTLENDNYEIIVDRKEAILNTIKNLDNSCLLILGKGHEDYQIINNEKIHFSDKEIVLDYINKN
ncbi:MAG: UDP-N-acetylmuramoyl-L-alanyl-D-glutamate--2,6-diaminopimelate ligase [Lactobacillales bacterium]|nr:UDP-N-acetylmuramoyl-L-alanyl-D-glutamate--2,6-diaminopimelate ligase [Lactobacillales bacterium]